MAKDAKDRDVDPVEFMRRVMHISPEDAEKVRDRTSPTRKRGGTGPQEGPSADLGDYEDA